MGTFRYGDFSDKNITLFAAMVCLYIAGDLRRVKARRLFGGRDAEGLFVLLVEAGIVVEAALKRRRGGTFALTDLLSG